MCPNDHMTADKQAREAPLTSSSPKERILEASAELFMRQGFAATSVRQIGEEAGVSQSALYYHIQSKTQLLRALHERFLDDMLRRLRVVESKGGSPSTRLQEMIDVVLSIIENHQAEVTVYLREQHALPEELRIDIVKQRDLVDDVFNNVISDGIKTGEFRSDLDVNLTRLAILGACNWTYQWFRPGGLGSSEIASTFSDVLLNGVLSDADGDA